LSRYHVNRCIDAEARLEGLIDDLPLAAFAPGRLALDTAAAALVPTALLRSSWIRQAPAEIVRAVQMSIKDKVPIPTPSDERRHIATYSRDAKFRRLLEPLSALLAEAAAKCVRAHPLQPVPGTTCANAAPAAVTDGPRPPLCRATGDLFRPP
jgi:hypothetical protein